MGFSLKKFKSFVKSNATSIAAVTGVGLLAANVNKINLSQAGRWADKHKKEIATVAAVTGLAVTGAGLVAGVGPLAGLAANASKAKDIFSLGSSLVPSKSSAPTQTQPQPIKAKCGFFKRLFGMC